VVGAAKSRGIEGTSEAGPLEEDIRGADHPASPARHDLACTFQVIERNRA
jgi:hypothetical protein